MFRFKQFTVNQSDCAMKVGTDGVLLGSWCKVENAVPVLDIGSGTGIIALMIAQRNGNAKIDAVEIDKAAAMQAAENVKVSPWPERIRLFCEPIRQFAGQCLQKYDLIVSNPPYFVNSLKSPHPSRTTARHADALPLEDLIAVVEKLLHKEGRFAVILPPEQAEITLAIASQNDLHLVRQTVVFTTPTSPVRRCLMEFSKTEHTPENSELVIEYSSNNFTEEYCALTKDFYLKF
jgi:tRNA1Val (adenine37-N6)-methyltransferase